MWPEWSAWTWWGLALLGLPMYFAPNIWAGRHSIVRVFSGSVGFVIVVQAVLILIAVTVAVGVIYYAMFVYEFPKWAWTHPTLSVAEQTKVRAECEMRAIEVGGSGTKIGSPRYEYESACLTAKGFKRERVNEE